MWVNGFGTKGYLILGMFFKRCGFVETEEFVQQRAYAKKVRSLALINND